PPPLDQLWTDPVLRLTAAEYLMAHTWYGGEAFPYFDPHLGPCSLAAYLGGHPVWEEYSVWFSPVLPDLTAAPPLRLDPDNLYWRAQQAIVAHAAAAAHGRYLVAFPDVCENVDILASLRGTTEFLIDMALCPNAVQQRLAELNIAYNHVFAHLHPFINDSHGGNCVSVFDIWGPGRTIKVQCDLAGMISPRMFNELVVPALVQQCQSYDYVLFHLDGSQALPHLDTLLQLDCIDAIEWTPEPGAPWGGSPRWYDLYRKILAAGKSVQAVFVALEEAEPLLQAVGSQGLFLMLRAPDETTGRRLLDRLERYRPRG
ncbi:MAG: uroporphyrinogen decarboxylase family protein, partial [bacterium]|nr:uroporphyrinogen decarboxylase family protein [bacterium]